MAMPESPTTEMPRETLWSFVPRRLRKSLGQHGVISTLRRAWRTVTSSLRERRMGIKTTGSIDGEELAFDASSFGYQPVPYATFDAAMRHVEVRANEDVFIDYGCGLGRAVVLAATRPFRQVIGVERSEELAEAARENVKRATRQLRCKSVVIECEDARTYEVPTDVTHVFMFNPFDEPILLTVMARIRDSIHQRPRKLTIIYALPKCRRDPLLELPWLSLKHELKTIDSDWQRLAIYEPN